MTPRQPIGVRIAGKGIETSERSGHRRWVIERPASRLSGYRRLSARYERHPRTCLASLGLAAAMCCYERLATLTLQDTVYREGGTGSSCQSDVPSRNSVRTSPGSSASAEVWLYVASQNGANCRSQGRW